MRGVATVGLCGVRITELGPLRFAASGALPPISCSLAKRLICNDKVQLDLTIIDASLEHPGRTDSNVMSDLILLMTPHQVHINLNLLPPRYPHVQERGTESGIYGRKSLN